jgi:hypothetical protein
LFDDAKELPIVRRIFGRKAEGRSISGPLPQPAQLRMEDRA